MLQGLSELRVIELSDEKAEFCGKLLAWMGAEVIKVEPPGGLHTRNIPPFLGNIQSQERSLYFQLYNQGKKSITLDIGTDLGRGIFKRLVKEADVLIESNKPDYLMNLGLGYENLRSENNGLIMASITPFGQNGPWSNYNSSDIVSLSLGGVSGVCGYDPVNDHYDTPPITPNWGHSFLLGSIWGAIAVTTALIARTEDGQGDHLDISIHDVINGCTEFSMPYYIYNGLLVKRQEGRHALPKILPPRQYLTSDGKYICAYQFAARADFDKSLQVFNAEGIAKDLNDTSFLDDEFRARPENSVKIREAIQVLTSKHTAEDMFKIAQKSGMSWAPIRAPEEILADEHHRDRGFFVKVEGSNLGASVEFPGAPFIASGSPLTTTMRAPRVGEHNTEVFERLLRIGKTEMELLKKNHVT